MHVGWGSCSCPVSVLAARVFLLVGAITLRDSFCKKSKVRTGMLAGAAAAEAVLREAVPLAKRCPDSRTFGAFPLVQIPSS